MKQQRKQRTMILMTILFALAFPFGVLAAVTKEEAMAAAKKQVPSAFVLRDTDHDAKNMEWEFEYRSKNKKTEYEVTIDETTGKVKKVEMEKRFDNGGRSVRISKKKAKKMVTRVFKGISITRIKKKKDDGRYVYKIWFTGSALTGKAEVNTQSGKVIEWEVRY